MDKGNRILADNLMFLARNPQHALMTDKTLTDKMEQQINMWETRSENPVYKNLLKLKHQIVWMIKKMELRDCPENCLSEHVPVQEADGELTSYQCEWCACIREAKEIIAELKKGTE